MARKACKVILHLSDIHAQAGQDFDGLSNSVIQSIKGRPRPQLLVVSGDLGFQGAGVDRALPLVRALTAALKLGPERVVCCPGNHEVASQVPETAFSPYEKAMYTLLEDEERSRAQPTAAYGVDSLDIVALNSSGHCDHTFGRIDLEALTNAIKSLRRGSVRLAVVHHHWIPIHGDASHITNAYEALSLLVRNDFLAVLHGHRHMAMSVTVGTKTRIVGVGSINYPPERNINNQFNLIVLGRSIHRYRWVADATAKLGGMGRWVPQGEQW